MQEGDLRQILAALGIRSNGRASSKGWIAFPCPMAPWTHGRGTDRHASAAAKIDATKESLWACQTCKSRGSVMRLAYDLTSMRRGAPDQELIQRIQAAESGALLNVGEFGSFAAQEVVELKVIDEEMVAGIFAPAATVPDARRYLVWRGINREACERLELAWDDDPKDQRIIFPVRGAERQLYGFTGRTIDPQIEPRIKDYFGLPKRHVILGEHLWRQGYPKIIVEGLFAYAHMHSIGVYEFADIGALLGSEVTPEKAAILIKWAGPTYFFVDNDQAGQACLYGRIDPQSKEHRYAEGALAKLDGYLPTLVPDWPEWQEGDLYRGRPVPPGAPKDDPDMLTLAEVRFMMDRAWPTVPPKKGRGAQT